jgi:hypothetical protein
MQNNIVPKQKRVTKHLFLKNVSIENVKLFKDTSKLFGYHYNEFFEQLVQRYLTKDMTNGLPSNKEPVKRSAKPVKTRKKAGARH